MLNFVLLALSAFVAAFTTRRLLDGNYFSTMSANGLLFGFMISYTGLVTALLRIFNVQ